MKKWHNEHPVWTPERRRKLGEKIKLAHARRRAEGKKTRKWHWSKEAKLNLYKKRYNKAKEAIANGTGMIQGTCSVPFQDAVPCKSVDVPHVKTVESEINYCPKCGYHIGGLL